MDKADKLLKACEKGKVSLIAPELSKYEVGNAVLYKGLDIPMAKASLGTISDIPISFIRQSVEDLKEIIEIAGIEKVTFYDASFVELAKKEGAVLVSANPKHQKSFTGVKVIDLKDY